MRTYTPHWPYDTPSRLLTDRPSRVELEEDERAARRRAEQARRRKHAARRAQGLPEVEPPDDVNGYPF